MKGFLTVLIIVLTISSCNTDDSEPTVPICTEGTINVVHTQIDTIQDYTLADEFMEGVYRINSDEEFAAFFNEVPPAINYDSLTLLVAVVDAGDYTFTESIQTSYDCEAQTLNLNLSLYNYDENIDTLKYWRHVLVDSRFTQKENIKLNILLASCSLELNIDFTTISDSTISVSNGEHFLLRNELLYGYRPTCDQIVSTEMTFIANDIADLRFKAQKYNDALCTSINFEKIADFSKGSLIVYTKRGSGTHHLDYKLNYLCKNRQIEIFLLQPQIDFGSHLQSFVFPLHQFISDELKINPNL